MLSRLLLVTLALLGLSSLRTLDAAEDLPQPAAVAWDQLLLTDTTSKPVPLAGLRGERGLVVVFIGTECPVVQLYLPRLAELAPTFAKHGLPLVAVDANAQDTAEELAAMTAEFRPSFPMLRDEQARLADRLGATRTPEAVVLDASGAIRYRGRIDDQFAPGVQRSDPQRRFLLDAVEALARGAEVPLAATEATGCLIGRVKAEQTPPNANDQAVTYSDQIARVLARNCAACHRTGDIAPFELTDYASAAAWGETLLEAVDAGRMPPWPASPKYGKFLHEHRLSDEDRALLHAWVEAGCPEGDPSRLPPAAELQVAEETFVPDLVYPISDRPYEVPATGLVDYVYLAIDPGWTEDRWITRAQMYPGERSVVHHVLIFVQRPGVRYEGVYPGELIGGYVPGLRQTTLPDGTAYRVPAGSKIVLQMHYTPNGIPRSDLSYVGFKFAEPSTVEREATMRRVANLMFQIPPGEANYRAEATYEFRRDAVLLKLVPHMHVRGKSFRYEAAYPDGRREVLLDVPRWDFNWQLEYALAEPKRMPAGTLLTCTAVYDNSAANPANPDPKAWVTFGEQTWQEMLLGFFTVSEPRGAADERAPLNEVAGVVRRIVQAAATEGQSPSGNGEQIDRWTRRSFDLARAMARMRQGHNGAQVEEVEHVVLGGLAEARKQGLLRPIQPGGDEVLPGVQVPGTRMRRGTAFMQRGVGAIRELMSESDLREVRVDPVPWPLGSQPQTLPPPQPTADPPEELPSPGDVEI